jgi:hypothetical protein
MRAGKSTNRLTTLASTDRGPAPQRIVLIYYICFPDLALYAASNALSGPIKTFPPLVSLDCFF